MLFEIETPCLICGEGIAVGNYDTGPKICEHCRLAVMETRRKLNASCGNCANWQRDNTADINWCPIVQDRIETESRRMIHHVDGGGLVSEGGLIFMNVSRVCPFCHRVHSTNSPYKNIICECGGKYYGNTGDWINRNTGETIQGLRNKCGCDKCNQWKINKDETGVNCISFGFTRRILLNVLDTESSLTPAQKEAFETVVNTIERLDKEINIYG